MKSAYLLLGLGVAGALAFAGTTMFTNVGQDTAEVIAELPEIDFRALAATLTDATKLEASPREARSESVRKNETLVGLLDRIGADRTDSNGAIHAVSSLADLRRIRAGEDVTAWFEKDPNSGSSRLVGLSLRPEAERQILVSRMSSGEWVPHELKAKLSSGYRGVDATITTSIYDAALAEGAGDQQVVDFADIFGYDIDFQREVHGGDKFEIFYEAFTDERGETIKSGSVLFAAMHGKALDKSFYRFTTTDDGDTDYYDETGQSAKKFLMKTPINGARLSSGFGNRRHPILGYTKLHKGTDFAAPTGTPIYAAGNGVVDRVGPYSTYGNYIRIKHSDGYQTAYAHMSRFARGLKKGVRVKQGQVIGYVGTTGASTGPHLHYEVYVSGKAVNAMSLRLPTGRKLNGEQLKLFQTERERIDGLRTAEAKRQSDQLMADRREPALMQASFVPTPVPAPSAPDQRP